MTPNRPMTTLALRAPAKVNLFLDVLGKRPDGYHDIRSVVVPVSVYDRLVLETTRDGRIRLLARADQRFPGIPWAFPMADGPDNLVVVAARLLQEATGCRLGVRIRLEKHIPITGGLGGGSSDAAGVLRGLNALWGTRLPPDRLLELGARIGCDVPALVLGRPALMEGRGERVTPLALPPRMAPLHLLLVNPGLGVPTADIYGRWRNFQTLGSTDSQRHEIVRGLCSGTMAESARGLYNALEKTVFGKYPLLAVLKERLLEAGAGGALLSGSGGTVLALVRGRAHARDVALRVRAAMGCPLWAAPAVMLRDAWRQVAAAGRMDARRGRAGGGTARWCNGSTRPFGGQSLGSNPSRAIARHATAERRP